VSFPRKGDIKDVLWAADVHIGPGGRAHVDMCRARNAIRNSRFILETWTTVPTACQKSIYEAIWWRPPSPKGINMNSRGRKPTGQYILCDHISAGFTGGCSPSSPSGTFEIRTPAPPAPENVRARANVVICSRWTMVLGNHVPYGLPAVISERWAVPTLRTGRDQSIGGGQSAGRIRGDPDTSSPRTPIRGKLGRSFKTTNCLENVNALVEDRCAKVDCWKNSNQRQRWLAAALLDIEPRLRTVVGYRHLGALRDALQRELNIRGSLAKVACNNNEPFKLQLRLGLTLAEK